ncbi:methylated-DNA--[protein]-cysteine S-methyltransferase [Devosia sp. A16]|uniref:methylated-DNA--[protein]-cysteine S-methyltransferase n=1 Tax=Devosia sp. A16 TaxID=1736675 RepID=UPI0006D832F9|nr:methylated-DNA--[protein]-cysteine S-methyltransferase [Devosia sp. A16]
MARQNARSEEFFFKTIESPVGDLTLVGNDNGLAAVLWAVERPGRVVLDIVGERPAHPILLEAERQLKQYFDGQRRAFELKLNAQGTAFQKSVWAALLRIPFGETRTYRQIAIELGAGNATRAVGAANGRNPISIITPCHRLVGSDGGLTGFAGGLGAKAYLLNLEGAGSARRRDN